VQEGGQPASQPIGQPVNQPAREAAAAPAKPGTPAEHLPASVEPAAPSTSAGPFEATAIDVHITVPDDLVVKGNDIRVGQSSMGLGNVNVTVGGDVRIEKSAGGPVRLLGQVQTVRGTYDFQGRRFEIQRGGSVRFEGLPRFNPALDVTATRLISGVDTRVHVGGSVRRPELTLTSSPPLDQADILSLIIFGQPSNQLGEGQQVSLAQRASTIASGFVASKLAQSIGTALNLDTFEIQTGSDTGQTGATVTVGEQVGQRLYVKLRQGVGGDNLSEFVLDYQLTNFLRFESTMTQGSTLQRNIMQRPQQSGADLIFLFSF
jgi:translocation and assembly module TamB